MRKGLREIFCAHTHASVEEEERKKEREKGRVVPQCKDRKTDPTSSILTALLPHSTEVSIFFFVLFLCSLAPAYY